MDMNQAVDFYCRVLGFTLLRHEPDYASVQRGAVVLGLGPIAKLPDSGGYFTRLRLAGDRGLGVEIVLEVDDVGSVHDAVQATGYRINEPLQTRAWGLTDFRIADPDGYYLRITSRRLRDTDQSSGQASTERPTP
jgi:lactoylglutathione lyase